MKPVLVFLALICASAIQAERFPEGTIATTGEIPFLTKECQGGDMESCHRIGRYHEQRLELDQAKDFYEKACGKDFAKSCHNLGTVTTRGALSERGLPFWKKACALKFGPSCFVLGQWSEQQQEYEAALAPYGLACEYGEARGCQRKLALPLAQKVIPVWKKLNSNLSYYIALVMILSLVLAQLALSSSQRRIIQKQGHNDSRKRHTV